MKSLSIKHFLYIPAVLLLSACTPSPAKKENRANTDTTAPVLLSVKKMQGDLTILWAAIKEMHPAYGMYAPADTLQKVYNEVNASLDQPLSETDYITHIYPLICRLGCGHTQLRHSEGYKAPIVKVPRLPFEVLVKKHRVWITTHQTQALNTGDEILSVNSIPAATIVNHGYNLYASDGYNETFKELFLSEYDGFEDVFNKYYHWQPPYKIALRTQQGVLKNITVDTIAEQTKSVSPSVDNYAAWTEAAHNLPLRFLKTSPATAWLQVKSYQYNDTIVFKEVFKQIHEKGVKNLVLDLRHNTGGDIRIAAKLLSFLADAPYHIIGDVWSRIPDPSINHFEKYFDTAHTNSFKAGFTPGKKEGANYHVNFNPAFGNMLRTLPLNKADHYAGNLYVLIDGATFSAGAHTTIAIKTQCKKAVFIGRETQGGAEGCSGGTIQHLTLPNTGVVVDFPWMRFISVAKNPPLGHGIQPGYLVEYNADDVVNKRDLDIEKALSLIK